MLSNKFASLFVLTLAAIVAATPVNRNAVDDGNTSWVIGPTKPADARSEPRATPNAVDEGNTSWVIEAARATPVAVAPVDSDNDGWKIKGTERRAAVAEKRAVDDDNKSWTIEAERRAPAPTPVNVDQDCCSAWTAGPDGNVHAQRAAPTPAEGNVDDGNSKWTIEAARALPTLVARAVDSSNTNWTIGSREVDADNKVQCLVRQSGRKGFHFGKNWTIGSSRRAEVDGGKYIPLLSNPEIDMGLKITMIKSTERRADVDSDNSGWKIGTPKPTKAAE
ncbi:hypothetical protein MKEN_00537300 [Mycena kentingensis (nom. inval.)]|nr:hypothetical protein MKEN_00537300 [Mycena kentingensis (nom. inval.)]